MKTISLTLQTTSKLPPFFPRVGRALEDGAKETPDYMEK